MKQKYTVWVSGNDVLHFEAETPGAAERMAKS